ncbi:MAG: glycosyltransferase family 4 protein [Fimbriimonadales bacterium]|jgi:glycosyltransferase involved in cell wall biosynthesis
MRVLIVGPSPDVPGGVASVIRLMLQYPPEGVKFLMHPTLSETGAAAHLPRWHPRYYARVTCNLAYFLRALRALRSLTSSADLAHVHVASYGSTFRKYFVVRILYRHGIPFILHNHGAEYHIFYENLPSLLKQRVRSMFQQAAGVIVLSEWWARFHRESLGSPEQRLWILPNPVILPLLEPNSTTGKGMRLLYLGRMDERKGSERVLRAIAQLPAETRAHVRLSMAGDGAVEEMRHLARQLGIESLVDIRSWIAGSEKERWLRESHAFILPSRAEGLPMAMLEAMAYGKAVIVSPVGGIPEWVTDGQEGFLVPPDDIPALSEAIRRMVESPELCRQMGLRARQRVEPLSVENYRQKLGAIYEEVLRRKAGKITVTLES